MVGEFEFLSRGALRAVVAPPRWLRVEHSDRRQSPAEVWEHWPDAAGLLDGPMWANSHVAGASASRPLFRLLDRVSGVDVPSQRPDEGVVLSVVGDHASAHRGGTPREGASVAVQGWPSLVVAGEVVATNVGTNAERVPRAAWALLTDGRVALAATRASAMQSFAVALRDELGATWAGYTDGGSSTYLGGRAAPWDAVSAPSPRVFSWLVLTPGGVQGSARSGLGVVPVLLGAGALWWLARRGVR